MRSSEVGNRTYPGTNRYAISPAVASSLACLLLLSGCGPGARFTAEEAAYYEEAGPIGKAACAIGSPNIATLVAADSYDDRGAYSPTHVTYTITRLEVPASGQLAPTAKARWEGIMTQFDVLLPPDGADYFHSTLQNVVRAQAELSAASESESKEREKKLAAMAARACRAHNAFVQTAMQRPLPPKEGPVLAVSYSPPGVPVNVGLNNRGKFSVSVSDSINTPVGTFSASLAPSDAPLPKRLIIVADGKERRFLLDRPFRVFVPADYGVDVSNEAGSVRVKIANKSDRLHETTMRNAGGG